MSPLRDNTTRDPLLDYNNNNNNNCCASTRCVVGVYEVSLFFLQGGTIYPVAEFKEFERRFKFKPRLKCGWFHLKLYQMFQDLSRRLI